MEIGKVIRKYRREKQLTQEQMAGYLGVTAPAVNKWENGNTFPDISLLAPIARLLGISTDTLLSFREELTEQEIEQILRQADRKLKSEEYTEVFRWAEDMIKEYPNCDNLILNLAILLDSYRTILGVADATQYDEKILQLYHRMLESADSQIMYQAAGALFQFSLMKEEYEKAQEYLDRIPKQRFQTKRMQALLESKKGNQEESSRMYEELLYASYSDAVWALTGLYALTVKNEDMKQAEYLIRKQQELAKVFEMGRYMEVAPGLEPAMRKKDKEETLRILEEIVESAAEIGSFQKSPLYSHMHFAKNGSEGAAASMMFMLAKGFEQEDEEMEFLKGDVRYEALVEKVRKMVE